jgi:hypothetical protein
MEFFQPNKQYFHLLIIKAYQKTALAFSAAGAVLSPVLVQLLPFYMYVSYLKPIPPFFVF